MHVKRDVGEAAAALSDEKRGGDSEGMDEMLRELSSLISGLREWRSARASACSDQVDDDGAMIAAWLEVWCQAHSPPLRDRLPIG